jgi:hypothetical protein
MTKDMEFLCVSKRQKKEHVKPLNSLLVFSVFLTMFVFDAIHLVHISVTKLYLSVTSGADGAFDHVLINRRLGESENEQFEHARTKKYGRHHALTHSQRHTNTHINTLIEQSEPITFLLLVAVIIIWVKIRDCKLNSVAENKMRFERANFEK